MDEISQFFQKLKKNGERYIEDFGLIVKYHGDLESNTIDIHPITSYIEITGSFYGGFLFTVDRSLAIKLVNCMGIPINSEQELSNLSIDIVLEISNMISGSSLEGRDDIMLGVPLMLVSNKGKMKKTSGNVLASFFETDYGFFKIIFFPQDGKGTNIFFNDMN